MPEGRYSTDRGDGSVLHDAAGRLLQITLPGTATADAERRVGDQVTESLEQYFSGSACLLANPTMIESAARTPLQRSIYEAVSMLAPGTTASYTDIARAVGRPRAARAVGAAMAANPFPPFIPCHRVVGSDGSLRGYAGGLAMKRDLLDMEQKQARDE